MAKTISMYLHSGFIMQAHGNCPLHITFFWKQNLPYTPNLKLYD